MRSNAEYIHVPKLSLVILIGASSSGKSTFARKHFLPSEIVSSDQCRAMVSDDENSLAASKDAFELARYIVAKRLKNGLLTVVDATNVQENARKDWIRLAREYHVLPVAIVVNTPEKICSQRSRLRPDRDLGPHVIPQQISQLRRSLRYLKPEGFRHVFELSMEDIDNIKGVIRDPLYNDKKEIRGPFDIIGDIHGCLDELVLLLEKLGYRNLSGQWIHPEGRKPIFLGDLVDRGPDSPGVLKLVMPMVKAGLAWCVPGNHDDKLRRWLIGKQVHIRYGLEATVAQLAGESDEFRKEIAEFIDGLISHYVFDDGRLVVAHAGLKESMQGRGSGAVREFCLYGETTGETDEFGLPIRYNWAAEYKGKAMVVYGHTPVPEAQWLNNTIDIDTGCVFGGSLTALRYPEKELVSVPAAKVYSEPVRPIAAAPVTLTLQQQQDDVLDISDFTGKLIVPTKYGHNITIREEHSIAALEVMSRFAVDPRWLIYLPPTMSPSETSTLPDFLEYPTEAFDYFKRMGLTQVICEKKHMGSRAILIVARNAAAIEKAFGIRSEATGVIYTRTGRAFFSDIATEQALLQRLNAALEASGFYEEHQTDWVCLDAELMPWSSKAQVLLQNQYGAVGAVATGSLHTSMDALQKASSRSDVKELISRYAEKQEAVQDFITAYRHYCWPVKELNDYTIAPFHILATEGRHYFNKDHGWHMNTIAQFCSHDPQILLATEYQLVNLEEESSIQQATDWWLKYTAEGGEGMVVKPLNFIATNEKGLIQPAIKVRGREYLRIIYGPEYTMPENLNRLKNRGLNGKRSLALREFALGVEGVERFTEKQPLRNIHACVFGVLALESEPVDPRL
ncbi:MAG: polynucleotide kinase-phosphatase [Pseudobacter sp.]|uniref:polynucleotide kinase-phosphatase n=1 Tax=Pseudobacter sp. TaxID=2045420 RepID=UPI003F80C8D0